jgi:flagellar basal body-associated protein FliL
MLGMRAIVRTAVIIAALVLVVWWILDASPSFQTCIQEKQNQAANHDPQKDISAFLLTANSYRDCILPIIHDSHNEILAAFTIVLAIATIFLWFTISDLVRGAEQTAQRQLRAHIGVTTREVPSLIVGEKQSAGVFFTNHGQTPALRVRYRGDVRILKNGLPSGLPRITKFRVDCLPLNPGQKIPIVYETSGELTVVDERAIRDDVCRFYSYGEIEYFDVFGRRRITTYRFMYGGSRLISGGHWAVCKNGNDQK